MSELQVIPDVCFIDDLARILQISRRSIERLRARRLFPIEELAGLDSRPRWSGDAVRRYLAGQRPAAPLRRVG